MLSDRSISNASEEREWLLTAILLADAIKQEQEYFNCVRPFF